MAADGLRSVFFRVWRHVARHRVHRHARGHRQVPHPSRRPQGQLQRPPPRTAAACPASATPSLPITAPIVSAPAVAPRALRSPARIACLPCVRDCRLEIASPRPRPVCSRTGIEPDNNDTDTAATMSIDGLFYLSVGSPSDGRGRETALDQGSVLTFGVQKCRAMQASRWRQSRNIVMPIEFRRRKSNS